VNLTRTAWNQSYKDSILLKNEKYIINTHPFACPHCLKHQGQIYTKEDKLINCIETIAKTTNLPVYVPINIGCGFGGGNWESILNKLQNLNLDNLYLLDTFSYEIQKVNNTIEINEIDLDFN
jgi:hypothetical protein